MYFSRVPDFVMTNESAGDDRVIVDMHFGGLARPFRAVIRTDRESALEDSTLIMQAKAKALQIWDGKEPWEKSLPVALFREAMRHVGETQKLRSFEYGVSLFLCIRDRTCKK